MIGFTDEHTRQLAGDSSYPGFCVPDPEGRFEDCSTCPYLKRGGRRNICSAYLGRTMVPSGFEEMNYCSSHSHVACAWFQANAGEVADEHRVAGSDSPHVGMRPAHLLVSDGTR